MVPGASGKSGATAAASVTEVEGIATARVIIPAQGEEEILALVPTWSHSCAIMTLARVRADQIFLIWSKPKAKFLAF